MDPSNIPLYDDPDTPSLIMDDTEMVALIDGFHITNRMAADMDGVDVIEKFKSQAERIVSRKNKVIHLAVSQMVPVSQQPEFFEKLLGDIRCLSAAGNSKFRLMI